MKLLYVIALALGASIGAAGPALCAEPAAPSMTAAQKAALDKTIETCGTCHGVNGRSTAPTFPNLAAQTAPYIELQLHAFKDQTRADPDAQAYMWGMASQLSDSTISAPRGAFCRGARGARQAWKSGAHSARKATLRRRCSLPADPAVRDLSRRQCAGHEQLSEACGTARPVSAQATARNSKRVAHRSRHARGSERPHQRANGSARCLPRVHLDKRRLEGDVIHQES